MLKTAGLSSEAEKLMPEIKALTIEDRLRIAGQLLADDPDSTSDSPEEIEAAWKDEICRRVEEIKSGKVAGIPAEEVFRRMHEKYG